MATPAAGTFIASCTIADGVSLSSAVEMRGCHLETIALPAGWDTASITFEGSLDYGVTYQSIEDNTSTEVAVTATPASKSLILPPLMLGKSWTHIKLRSGSVGVPINQAGAVVLTLGMGRY